MQETVTNLLQNKCPLFLERFQNDIVDAEDFRGDLSIEIKPQSIQSASRFLLSDNQPVMDCLMDLFAVDYLKFNGPAKERFAMIYNFASLASKRRIRLKVFLPETSPEIDSLTSVTPMANWFEREAWDLYGIRFIGHPNLQRILCHHEFEGHPLRKDYPADKYQRLKMAAPSTGF